MHHIWTRAVLFAYAGLWVQTVWGMQDVSRRAETHGDKSVRQECAWCWQVAGSESMRFCSPVPLQCSKPCSLTTALATSGQTVWIRSCADKMTQYEGVGGSEIVGCRQDEIPRSDLTIKEVPFWTVMLYQTMPEMIKGETCYCTGDVCNGEKTSPGRVRIPLGGKELQLLQNSNKGRKHRSNIPFTYATYLKDRSTDHLYTDRSSTMLWPFSPGPHGHLTTSTTPPPPASTTAAFGSLSTDTTSPPPPLSTRLAPPTNESIDVYEDHLTGVNRSGTEAVLEKGSMSGTPTTHTGRTAAFSLGATPAEPGGRSTPAGPPPATVAPAAGSQVKPEQVQPDPETGALLTEPPLGAPNPTTAAPSSATAAASVVPPAATMLMVASANPPLVNATVATGSTGAAPVTMSLPDTTEQPGALQTGPTTVTARTTPAAPTTKVEPRIRSGSTTTTTAPGTTTAQTVRETTNTPRGQIGSKSQDTKTSGVGGYSAEEEEEALGGTAIIVVIVAIVILTAVFFSNRIYNCARRRHQRSAADEKGLS